MSPTPDIKILPVTEEDYTTIAEFVQKFFFPEEPLNSSLKRCPEPENIPFLNLLKENLSLKAVNLSENSEDNLAAVVINKKKSLEKPKDADKADCPKIRKIRKILEELDEKAKIWERVNYETHFNILALSVNSKYRGLKLGERLVEESLKLAKSLNYKFVAIECSSFYSSRIVANMGFEKIAAIPYEEYLDENGEQIFKVNKIHTSLNKFYIKL